MKKIDVVLFAVLASAALAVEAEMSVGAASPYAKQASRPIKALTAEEVSDLRSVHGMGLSKAAELNRQPGPRHVLDLAAPLALTPIQKAEIQAVFDRMDRNAKEVGSEIVRREQLLDSMFVEGQIPRAEVEHAVSHIAVLQGKLRFIHIDAHLQTAQRLTPQQIAVYDRLRGYEQVDQLIAPAVHHNH